MWSSVWEPLWERLYVNLYVFYGKMILLRMTDLYQIPPKPSPVEANPSPEHPGGTRWNPGGTPVEPWWNPGGIRKNPGEPEKSPRAAFFSLEMSISQQEAMFWSRICQSRNNKHCFGQEYVNLAKISNVLVNLAAISNVLVKNMSISQQ